MKTDNFCNGEKPSPDENGLQAVLAEIVRSLRHVRFGSVEITIHDSRVVQIERKEKVRFAPAPRSQPD
jgi:hypothetical protein